MRTRDERLREAQVVLHLLNFDRERCNERSALVLLALLDLPPSRPWAQAATPMLRTVEIMEWLRDNYEQDYKPNTRETIRRRTLHQFAEACLIEQNPDQTDRPVNSPKWCYQVGARAISLLRSFGSSQFDDKLREYLADLPGLQAQYKRAREMRRIRVMLPDESVVSLSPGGQNPLLKLMIEEFCERFTPGGRVLYVGDADEKLMVFAKDEFANLGITIDSHGKMPDLVVHLPDRNWVVLMEAVSSHGPVDSKRRGELKELFRDATADLVFVSCFPSREEMRKYLHEIAWETEVWCADNPTHLIHFNGERFLGPY